MRPGLPRKPPNGIGGSAGRGNPIFTSTILTLPGAGTGSVRAGICQLVIPTPPPNKHVTAGIYKRERGRARID